MTTLSRASTRFELPAAPSGISPDLLARVSKDRHRFFLEPVVW
jgi:hypothetical protein